MKEKSTSFSSNVSYLFRSRSDRAVSDGISNRFWCKIQIGRRKRSGNRDIPTGISRCPYTPRLYRIIVHNETPSDLKTINLFTIFSYILLYAHAYILVFTIEISIKYWKNRNKKQGQQQEIEIHHCCFFFFCMCAQSHIFFSPSLDNYSMYLNT